MIVDSSAIVAVFVREPGFEELVSKLADSPTSAVGAPTLVETGIVLETRLRRDPRALLSAFLQEFQITIAPFDEIHWRQAVEAYRRFGRGRHRAALNFGDCLSYALAKVADRPLLCVGEDFPKTDIRLA